MALGRDFVKNFDDLINNLIIKPLDNALTAATNKLGSLGGGEATVTNSKVAGISFGSIFSFGRDAEPAIEAPKYGIGRSAEALQLQASLVGNAEYERNNIVVVPTVALQQVAQEFKGQGIGM